MFHSWGDAGLDRCCCGGGSVPAEIIHAESRDLPVPDGASDTLSEESRRSESSRLAPVEEESSGLEAFGSSKSLGPSPSRRKMLEMRHMELDHLDLEITRAIPLHRALRTPELWTSPDEIRRKELSSQVWDMSTRVETFDIFLSHTWRTKGRWKVLALMLQTGWLHGLLGWSIALAVMLCLRGFEVINDPWHNNAFFLAGKERPASLSPFTVIAAQIGLVLGLCLSPYLPFKTQMCFLDVACIHQSQSDLFERGIYSIGGFLSVAKELRVLYTPEYLASLWCVFELVGFRRVNPEGKLTFAPLFLERSAAIVFVGMCVPTVAKNFLVASVEGPSRQLNIVLAHVVCVCSLMILIVQNMRFNYREKARLISDLKNFDVDKLNCTSDFDRAFIFSAIESWYGSREAFNEYVRSDLREELLNLLPSPHLPCTYAILIICGEFAWALDRGLSMYKTGFSVQEISRHLLATLAFFGCWMWFAFNSMFYLSDKSASLAQIRLLDWMKTLVVCLAVLSWLCFGLGCWLLTVRSNSWIALICFMIFSKLQLCFMLDMFKCRRPCDTWRQTKPPKNEMRNA